MKRDKNKDAGKIPETVTTVQENGPEKPEKNDGNIIAENKIEAESSNNGENEETGFWEELWEEFKEPIFHFLYFAFALIVLTVFGFFIPLLPIVSQVKTALKILDYGGIILALFLYTANFLYRTIKHISKQNPELTSLFLSLPARLKTDESKKTDSEIPKTEFSYMMALHRISDLLIIASLAVTLIFAINFDTWLLSFLIPIGGFLKGILFILASPSELINLGWVCVFCFVAGSSIGAANLYRKEFPSISWWIPAVGLLGLGFGIATGIVKIESMKLKQQRRNR